MLSKLSSVRARVVCVLLRCAQFQCSDEQMGKAILQMDFKALLSQNMVPHCLWVARYSLTSPKVIKV